MHTRWFFSEGRQIIDSLRQLDPLLYRKEKPLPLENPKDYPRPILNYVMDLLVGLHTRP
jgi:hypothetical protein